MQSVPRGLKSAEEHSKKGARSKGEEWPQLMILGCGKLEEKGDEYDYD